MIKNARPTIQESSGRPSGDFLKTKDAKLVLKSGKEFAGLIPQWQADSVAAEVVFNTGMTGYVESLTDPSYAEQILTFTYPLIGNYGVHKDGWESNKIHAKGVVVSELTSGWNHPQSQISLLEWLKEQQVPIIFNVDTRALTQHLRSKGVIDGIITSQNSTKLDFTTKTPLISVKKPEIYNAKGKKKVILVDCGAKENIARSLVNLGLSVKRVPYNYNLANEHYDGIVLSNGPGDPTNYKTTIDLVRKALKNSKPIFGICLGNQIMALAAGAKTYKLKFGHRGHNQPCQDQTDQRCYITSQNHGYAVNAKTLSKDWKVLFTNLNDGSVEGIEHVSKPFFAVQFHPEASPGPTDTRWLFERFYSSL